MACLFAGQGFFEAGMGEETYKNNPRAREVFDESSEALGISMARVCFGDLVYMQDDPRVVQPAIVTVGLAEYAAYAEQNGYPDYVTGMSLGYLAAMGAAEVFGSYGQTIQTVAERAAILYEIHRQRPGGMAGFVGLAKKELDPILKKTGAKLAVSRDKLRHSFVVTGRTKEIDDTETEVRKNGVRNFERLKIAGWFHHDDNAEAQPRFKSVLDSLSLSEPKIRLLGNNAIFLDTASAAAQHAIDQLVEPVEWDDTIEVLNGEGVTHVLEVGADRSRSLARQMSKRFKTNTIHFPETA